MSASVTRGYALTAIMKLSTRFTCTVKWVLIDVVLHRALLQISWPQLSSVEVFLGHVLLPWFTRVALLFVGFYSPPLLAGWKTSTNLYCFPCGCPLLCRDLIHGAVAWKLLYGKDKSLLAVGCSFQFLFQMMERKIVLFPTDGFFVWVVELSYGIPRGGILITCWCCCKGTVQKWMLHRYSRKTAVITVLNELHRTSVEQRPDSVFWMTHANPLLIAVNSMMCEFGCFVLFFVLPLPTQSH